MTTQRAIEDEVRNTALVDGGTLRNVSCNGLECELELEFGDFQTARASIQRVFDSESLGPMQLDTVLRGDKDDWSDVAIYIHQPSLSEAQPRGPADSDA